MTNVALPITPFMLLNSRLNGRFAQASIAFLDLMRRVHKTTLECGPDAAGSAPGVNGSLVWHARAAHGTRSGPGEARSIGLDPHPCRV